jgi:hypothetical protein
LIVGRRAIPISWRAYAAAGLKGPMKRYELAVIRRAVTRVIQKVGHRRVRVTADRGFADVALFTRLPDLRVACVIRVKKSPNSCIAGVWRRLDTRRFAGNTRRRGLGHLLYCAENPQRLWVTMSRKHDRQGTWASGIWWPLGRMGQSTPWQNMPTALAARRAFARPTGGWVSPKRA